MIVNEIIRSVDLIKENEVITEVEVPSIMHTQFRKRLNNQLKIEDIDSYCFAEEYIDEG